ncbi:HAMP domain-containing sensor histidine kinase [Sphingomonas sp. HITSZ_GF]|uniref:sensor histidine kinase n=1 Tax=Sphingomonas sp. HITSZ_GF TaxID=3037247 RepID=UPI00240E7099|nr:HAMP domain-containing sensor histidine kinase [Sphingomonas sp. HITSZ_GF]MDG2533493.1 HAMP domain-containing sensor histidine kinase [Sphingomonas sp. HITSZ_GF]
MLGRLTEALKAPVRRHWPRLRLRTILLVTFVFVAALPGVGALFLRVYENTLVRQTEAELIAQGTALSAITSAEWPGSHGPELIPRISNGIAGGPLSTIDLGTRPQPERPEPAKLPGTAAPDAQAAAAKLAPLFDTTADSTLASILLLAPDGRILIGKDQGKSLAGLPELAKALRGRPETVLRRNGDYHPEYAFEWLSRASGLRIHHARPVVVNGKVVAVLLLSRSPRALFRGLYEDRGKILFGIGAIFATLVALSGLLSRGIARPIEMLSQATRDVARGGGAVPEAPRTAAIEIQALYSDFATMADAIDRRSRYLRDFAHAVSHEFKTPLAGIRGAIEILEDHHAGMDEADRRRFLANAGADADRLAQLVTRLLELARADMAEAEADAATDVALPLRRIADAWADRGLAITIDLPETLSRAAMPGAMLEAIVESLVENSRQAGAGSVRMAAAATEGEILLTIADDGPGIPEADRARIFEPFFTSRRAAGGTGLGLPIARSLLASHGGTITLATSAQGTGFDIRLPVA